MSCRHSDSVARLCPAVAGGTMLLWNPLEQGETENNRRGSRSGSAMKDEDDSALLVSDVEARWRLYVGR